MWAISGTKHSVSALIGALHTALPAHWEWITWITGSHTPGHPAVPSQDPIFTNSSPPPQTASSGMAGTLTDSSPATAPVWDRMCSDVEAVGAGEGTIQGSDGNCPT